MGLGGNLMWTQLAYEIHKKTGKITVFVNKKKIYEDKLNLWKNLDFILDNSKENLTYNFVRNNDNYFLIDLDIRPDLDKNRKPNIICHTVNARCSHFGYYNIEPTIYMKFSEDEKKYIKKIVNNLPKNFIVIEPHAKTSWCEHKQYPLDKWQRIIDVISDKIAVVQMSLPSNRVMNNVINIGDEIKNFRQACLLLKYAKLFIATEGGLMHGAKVHNTKCIMIFCPMFDPIWTKYNTVVPVWVRNKQHFNCFNEGTCQKCLEIMNNHDEQIIINKILNNI